MAMKLRKKTIGLKISELAEQAGVTIPTVRHYLQAGLLPQPFKTGKTMAYYNPACIDRIRLIKRLQRERFLPIEVIKRLIDAGEVFDEESEIGQVLTKSNLFPTQGGTVTAEELTAATGYSTRQLRRLHRSGLVVAKKGESGPGYDALDAELVKLVKKRESAGLPLAFTIKSIEMYQDAIESVVSKNTRRVLTHLITHVPVENIGGVLKEVEDSLDALVLLLRQKVVRRINKAAMGELNAMAEKLEAMIFLPVAGRHLPDTIPADPWEKIICNFCTGNFESALNTSLSCFQKDKGAAFLLSAVLAHLFLKHVEAAVALVERHLAEPVDDPLINAVAALAFVYAAALSAGITGPIQKIKKAWPYLEKCNQAPGSPKLNRILTQYVCGVIYAVMPEIFGFKERGLSLLARAGNAMTSGARGQEKHPRWVVLTLTDEIIPAVAIRVNRLLAERYSETLIGKSR